MHAVTWLTTVSHSPAEPFDIRCAARCDWPNLSHHTVGSLPHYRADSYVCAAAIHAGLIGTYGGCIRAAFNGPHWDFAGSDGSGGLTSESFDSWFPLAFTLTAAEGSSHCGYFHWSFLFVGLTLFFVLSLLRPPPVVVFSSLLLYGYYYVATTMNDSSTQESVFFTACERLFYVCTFGYCMYKLGPAVTLGGHDEGKLEDRQSRAEEEAVDDSSERDQSYSQLRPRSRVQPHDELLASSLFSEDSPASTASSSFSQPATSPSSLLSCSPCRAWWFAYGTAPFNLHLPSSHPLAWHELYFLYCVPCFAALHFGYLSMVLPDIDLNSQAFSHGLAGVFVILFFSALTLVLLVSQARLLYSSGLMRLYGACYGCVALVIVVVSAVWYRSYSFHLHHVLVAPLLFPLTRFRTRLSVVAQALLLGLFLNGFAMWGFSADWDYTPPPSPATVDDVPPSVLYVRNASQVGEGQPQSQQVVWSLRNDTGTAIGSSLYINGVQLFHASFSDTDSWWNATLSPPLPASTQTATQSAEDEWVIVQHGSTRGVPHIHRYDHTRSPRLYRRAVASQLGSASHSVSTSHSLVSKSAALLWANGSTGGWMGVAPLPSLVGGWNYTIEACYTFTYGSVGPCTDPLLLWVANTSSMHA